MKMTVHIERLVLEGLDLPAAARPRFQAALEAELARLLEGGVGGSEGRLARSLETAGAVPALDGGAFHLAPGAPPAHLARQIAGQVAQVITAGNAQERLGPR